MKTRIARSLSLLITFILWTTAVCLVDVKAIGPQGSSVGFAALNGYVHSLTGVHFTLYTITDWLGLVPIAVCAGFGTLGLVQWIRRRHIWNVDRDILILGVFYVAVMAVYLLFEELAVNARPVLINGFLEASYPSSTTMLVLCVMPTARMQLTRRIRNRIWRNTIVAAIIAFTVFMVIGRLLSGVHWISDILGGILLSTGLVEMYKAFAE